MPSSSLTDSITRWRLADDQAQLLRALQAQLDAGELCAPQVWRELCAQLLRPEQPFELHQQLHAATFAGWDAASRGPPPVWVPDAATVAASNAARFMATFQGDMAWAAGRTGDPAADWRLLQRVSCDNPDVFWGELLGRTLRVALAAPPARVLTLPDVAQPDGARWLPGARLNIASAALHSPLSPGPDAPALTWAADGSPTQLQHVSWAELRDRVMHAATAIAASYQPGDALALALPLTPAAVVLYLATIAAGCVAVSIADSFSAAEVATRLRLSGAKALFTQDVVLRGGKALPLYTRLLDAPGGLPQTLIVVPAAGEAAGSQQQQSGSVVTLRSSDMWLREFLVRGTDSSSSSSSGGGGTRPLPHIVDAAAPCNILFSSGTTGEPKAIPWSHTTPLRAAVDGWAHQNIGPGSRVAWPTNLGWMMGPWLLFASLLNGATIALYTGAPLGRDFGEFVAAARVTMLGLVPSIVKAWRASGCMDHLAWPHLSCFSSTGEASSPEDYHWLTSRVAGYRPVIEYCGGTEIGGGFLSGSLLQPQAAAAFSTPTLGARLVVLQADGGQLALPCDAAAGTVGELALTPPMLGSSQALLGRDHAAVYFGGMPAAASTGGPLRRHGDEVQVLPGGYYRALGRVDDTMNLGGIKVASVELERVVQAALAAHVVEVAAVGVPAPGGGPELLHLFVVPAGAGAAAAGAAAHGGGSGGASSSAELLAAAQGAVKAQLNPLFKVHRLAVVDSLPRTASNKVMRRLLRDQAMAAAATEAGGEGAVPPRARL